MKITRLDNNNRVKIDLGGQRVRTPYQIGEVVKLSDELVVKVLSYENKTIIGKELQPSIYVWTTKSYSKTNTYKVGLVNWQSVKTRINQTDTTGVLEKIEIVRVFPLSVYDPKVTEKIEDEIHNRIGLSRKDKSREAVQADYKSVIEPTILEVIQEFKSKKVIGGNYPTPRYFQKDACEIAKDYYKTNDRGWIQWTCGSGKSSGGYFIWDESIPKSEKNLVVILVPNRQLVVQTHDDWAEIVKGRGKSFKSMKIGGVDGSTNDVGEISRWIDNLTNTSTNLIQSTYQSSHLVGQALKMSGVSADFVIYDEVHRLTGNESKVWMNSLKDSKFPAKKRLSMTASPVEYTTTSIGHSGLENEKKFGKKFHSYSFLDAQLDGYIAPLEIKGISLSDDVYDYYVDYMEKNEKVINKEMLKYDFTGEDDLDDINTDEGSIIFFAQLENTLNALESGEITHPVVYANSSARIKRFMAALKVMAVERGIDIPYMNIFSHKDKSIDHRIKELNTKFAPSKVGVIGNVYCLQEGISIKEIDSVIMIDPRSSGPAIIQIMGRPVRLNGPDKVAKIYLPILTKEENGKIVLDKDYFSTTTEWMLSLASSDEELASMILNGVEVTDKARDGVDLRDIKPKTKKGSISGVNRNLDKSVPLLSDVDFSEYKKSAKFKTIISTKNTRDKVMSTEQGQNDYLKKQAITYVLEKQMKLQDAINNFSSKNTHHYEKLMNTKAGYVEDFSLKYDIETEKSSSLLESVGLTEVVEYAGVLKEKSIDSILGL